MKHEKEIVTLKDIWVAYKDITVLEGVNLSIGEHDCLGIIGPNGGGKTTLLKVILGLIPPVRGTIKVLGKRPHEAVRFVGYVPQAAPYDREFPISVWDVVLMGRLAHRRLFIPYGDEDHTITKKALELVGMFAFKDRQIGVLSEGERQRVFIARALTTEPKLLLLDEPTASIDVPMQAGLYELLQKLKEEMAIVLVSHDIGVISSVIDKIACLNRKLFYHDSNEITREDLEAVYPHCPVEMIAHGIPHRVMKEHSPHHS